MSRRDCSSICIWLYALFMSAVVKLVPFIFASISCIGSMGQLNLNSSVREMRYLAPRTIFSDSTLARLMKVFPLCCSSFFTGDMISFCLRTSGSLFTLSCKWIGTLLSRCFLKTASGSRERCNGECIFPKSN